MTSLSYWFTIRCTFWKTFAKTGSLKQTKHFQLCSNRVDGLWKDLGLTWSNCAGRSSHTSFGNAGSLKLLVIHLQFNIRRFLWCSKSSTKKLWLLFACKRNLTSLTFWITFSPCGRFYLSSLRSLEIIYYKLKCGLIISLVGMEQVDAILWHRKSSKPFFKLSPD